MYASPQLRSVPHDSALEIIVPHSELRRALGKTLMGRGLNSHRQRRSLSLLGNGVYVTNLMDTAATAWWFMISHPGKEKKKQIIHQI